MLMARVEKDQCIYFAIGLPSFCHCYYLLSADACIHIRLLILRVERVSMGSNETKIVSWLFVGFSEVRVTL